MRSADQTNGQFASPATRARKASRLALIWCLAAMPLVTSCVQSNRDRKAHRRADATQTEPGRDGTPSKSRKSKSLTVRLDAPPTAVSEQGVTVRAYVSVAGEPVRGASVVFTINGQQGRTGVTDDEGFATVLVMPIHGRVYDIHARVMVDTDSRKPLAEDSLRVVG